MKKLFILFTLLLASSLLSLPDVTLSAQRHEKIKVSKHKYKKIAKIKVKSQKGKTKVSKHKNVKQAKIKYIRVRHASNINKPKEGEYLKLESIVQDLLSNEQ